MNNKNKKTPHAQSSVITSKTEPVVRAKGDIPKWALPVLLAVTALLYSKALFHELTHFDDYCYINQNPFLKELTAGNITAIFTTFYQGNYHPLTTLTYLFEYTHFGIDPFPYHFLNLSLHIANTWLVFKLCRRLSGKNITALVAAALFAIHPMHVESVAWVSERKDVLYTFFYLSALLIYLKYLSSGYRPVHYAVTMLLFICSLLSKSAAVTFPVLLVVVDVYKGRTINAKAIFEKAPFLLLSVIAGILNLMSQSNAWTDLDSTYNLMNRFFLLCYSISFYIVKLFVPVHLSAMHFFPGTDHGMLPWFYYASLPFLILVIWLVARKNKYRRELFFGFAFFLITISVMLQIIPVGSAVVSERYTYVAYIGLFYIAGEWLASQTKYYKIATGTFAIIFVLFGLLTWQRIAAWQNDETLFGDIIKKDPPHSIGMSRTILQRGIENEKAGNIEAAMNDYTQSVLFDPQFGQAYLYRAKLYINTSDPRAAIADFTVIIRLGVAVPLIYNKRGNLLFDAGEIDSAISDFSKAISLDSGYVEAYDNRGWALYTLGNKEAAMKDYNKAILLDSTYAQAYNNRGWSYFEAGNTAKALREYTRAIFFDPKNTVAYGNLGAIKLNTGDLYGAKAAFDSLILITPDDKEVYVNHAEISMRLKDTARACADWQKAASLGYKSAAQLTQRYCH